MNDTVELVLDAKAAHGEGPSWDPREGVLYWVDIVGCALHVYDPRTGRDRAIPTGREVCTVAPRAAGGVVAGLRGGFAFIDTRTGRIEPLADPEPDKPGNRFNDGKCDPAGRFWAGTCSQNCDVPGAGSLYRLEPGGGIHKVLGGLTISNGLAWSVDRHTMYFIDTPTLEVWAFDYEDRSGDIRNRRAAVQVPAQTGFPDGMTIDEEGMLWVAHWGGSRVCRWNPRTGAKLAELQLPVQQVSSCVFGGEDLDVLYITTSRLGLDEKALARQPLAGGLFSARPGVRGTATAVYGG